MKTDAINYDVIYKEARRLFFETTLNYKIDRKTESIAYLIALETALRVSDMLLLEYSSFKFDMDLKAYTFTTHIKKTDVKHTGVISNELYNYIETFKKWVLSLVLCPLFPSFFEDLRRYKIIGFL